MARIATSSVHHCGNRIQRRKRQSGIVLRKLIRSVEAAGFWSGEVNAVKGGYRAEHRRYRRPPRVTGKTSNGPWGICQKRFGVYKKARRVNPTRWSRSTRCWRQPEEVWINKPPEEPEPILALPLIQAA